MAAFTGHRWQEGLGGVGETRTPCTASLRGASGNKYNMDQAPFKPEDPVIGRRVVHGVIFPRGCLPSAYLDVGRHGTMQAVPSYHDPVNTRLDNLQWMIARQFRRLSQLPVLRGAPATKASPPTYSRLEAAAGFRVAARLWGM